MSRGEERILSLLFLVFSFLQLFKWQVICECIKCEVLFHAEDATMHGYGLYDFVAYECVSYELAAYELVSFHI